MSTTGKVIAGIVASAAAGAILGVLFAPDKGSETRKKIVAKSKKINDDVKEKVNDFIGNVKERFEQKEENDHGHEERSKAEMA